MMTSRSAALALTAFFAAAAPAFAAQTVTYDQVATGLAEQSIVLVDIREPDEFVSGHVPGAINLPLSKLTPAALGACACRAMPP